MAGSPTARGILGCLMTLIGTRRKIAWAGELRQMRQSDCNLKSLQHRDSIHSMTGVITRCGCFQVHLQIKRMRPWWKSTAPMHCIPLWNVWCKLSALKMKLLNSMRHTGWYRLQSPGQSGGGQNRNQRMVINWFGYRRRMHTLMISNELRPSKRNWRLLLWDTLHQVLQVCRAYIDGSRHVPGWYWETPRIGMMFQDIGPTNGHSIPVWILRFSHCWETHCCQCLSTKWKKGLWCGSWTNGSSIVLCSITKPSSGCCSADIYTILSVWLWRRWVM